MSESDKERSDVGGGGGGSGSGGDDDEDGGGAIQKDDKKKQGGHGCERCARKSKRMTLFRFSNVKKQLHRRNKRPSSATSCCLGKRVGGGGGGGCCLCFKQPQTLDSPVESQTSDPNSPEFTYELLKALIEKNDFYSKDCNPHLDRDSVSSSYTDNNK